MLMDNGHQPLLEQVARRYDRPEVMAAVGALLALDPLDNHPTKIPPLPAFYQPALWARPLLRENGLALPDDALKRSAKCCASRQRKVFTPACSR